MSHYGTEPLLLAEKIVNTCDTTRPDPEYLNTAADLALYLRRWNMVVAREPDAHDLVEVLALRRQLRAVFETREVATAVALVNQLLAGIQLTPSLMLYADGKTELKLDLADELPLARRLGAEAALGLCAELANYGVERFQICHAIPCTDIFIDTSRNHTRRYCCEQCANRHNVALHRRRKKAAL